MDELCLTAVPLSTRVANQGDRVVLVPGVRKMTRSNTGIVKCADKSISSDAMLYLVVIQRSETETESVFVHSNEIAKNLTTDTDYTDGDCFAPDNCNNLEALCL